MVPITAAHDRKTIGLAWLALFISPMFFSTNVVFGRAATDIAPFLLAFIRWSITSVILLLVVHRHWQEMYSVLKAQWRLLAFLGFLGMFICGGFVYLALQKTTATNGTLIYTIPPVIILLIERFWRGRIMRKREIFGVTLAITGVMIIIAKGSLQTLQTLAFNPGDLLFVMAAVSWAIYSICLKSDRFAGLGTLPLFALIAPFGALTLMPVALYEFQLGQNLPHTLHHWTIIAGIILCASLVAYTTFQHGVRILGSSIAGIFMYLLAPFGVTLAWFFLGETVKTFHLVGIVTILTGVILATFPAKLLKRSSPAD